MFIALFYSFFRPTCSMKKYSLLLTLTLLLFNPDLSFGKPDKPNFIIFLVDDLGWMDVGYMGSKYYETPNIDKMAKTGMVFTNAYANSPNCAPTRASIMSGLYATAHGVYTVGDPARGKSKDRMLIPAPNKTVLDGSFTTIPEALKKQGYTTAHMGKWHLGDDEETSPEAQGFDINIAGNHAGHPKTYFSPYKNPNLKDGKEGEYLTDRLTDEAVKFIRENKKNPFFLYLSHYAVHTPIQAKAAITEKYKNKPPHGKQDNAKYAAMVESTDQSLGKILETLKKLNLDENTLVLFFSDNGGHGGITHHSPLRGSKGMMYEGGFREPMIAWWPGRIPARSTSDEVVMGFDFFPTLVELAGESPESYDLHGESLTPLFFGEKDWSREAVFWHFPAYLQSYSGIKNPEDLVRGWRAVPSGAVRKGDWKLIENFEDGSLELYHLKNDISESENRAKDRPDKRDELHRELIQWRKQHNAPVPTEKNPEYSKETRK